MMKRRIYFLGIKCDMKKSGVEGSKGKKRERGLVVGPMERTKKGKQ